MKILGNGYNPYSHLYTRATNATEINTQKAEKTSPPDKVEQAKDSPSTISLSKPLISDSVNNALLQEQEQNPSNTVSKKIVLNTSNGKESIDIDDYFAPKHGSVKIDEIPILMPTSGNIQALSAHAEDKMKAFLKEHGIPAAPDKITYDNQGQIKLPTDYPHAAEFKQALEDDPAIERELQTLSALANQNVAFQKAMSGGGGAQTYIDVALNFGADGALSITANGKPYKGEDRGDITVSSFQTERVDSADASAVDDTPESSDPVKEFLDYMKMTPEERYYAMLLAEEGLTQEELEALPPEERLEIEEKIQAKIEERIANDTALGGFAAKFN